MAEDIATSTETSAETAALFDVLRLIRDTRDDQAPVFDAILKSAARLCEAPFAALVMAKPGDAVQQMVAGFGAEPSTVAYYDAGHVPMDPERSFAARAICETEVIHLRDMRDTEAYRNGVDNVVALAEIQGIRTNLFVPLVTAQGGIGCFILFRKEVRPFDDAQIALVKSFADQAVIAIEKAQQFRELQNRLERETGTRQILHVISQNRDDELPVFDAILENASRLCNAPLAFLSVANAERTRVRIPAYRGTRSEFGDILVDFEEPITRTELVAVRPITEGQVLRQDDITADETYRAGDIRRRQMADVEGARSVLCVPLLKEGVALGAIVLYRREIAPFSDDDVALVQSFAAQAVIAIENVRQFREVKTRLEREAATSEVLNVISQSRSDAQPVFHTILENAARLCGAPHAMLLLRDDADAHLVLAANNAAQSRFIDQLREAPHRLDNTSSYAVRAVQEQRVIHVPDLREVGQGSEQVPQIKVALDLEGMRTVLQVPLLQDERAIGVIALYKLEVAPFSDDQIDLVKTFAAQAVIAIENTKQLQNLEALNAELGDRVEAQVGELERMGRLKRFLPEQVADAVVSSGDDAMLSSHRALISALFCDIRGFTAFCETAEPEETIEVLQTYHEEMGKLISAHGAGVDHRAGDGIMVLFNDPLPCDDPAGDALRLAFAMRQVMADLCKRWRKLGHRLGFGVGISLGYATVGMVGSEGRFHYTASGTAVNLAARLCDMASDGEILLSPRAWIAVEQETQGELVGEVDIKGISAPVEVWRAVAPAE